MNNQEQPIEQSADEAPETQASSSETQHEQMPLVTDEAQIAELEGKLEQAQAAAAEEKDRAIRAVAEMENLRRRAAQDVEKAHKFALEKFAGELLPVIDNLERALELADKEDEAIKPMLEGIELTLRSMLSTVAKFGVVAIDPQGETFDPNRHQAMSLVENAELPANSVLAVMQKGYELNGRVIRPAMVMVTKAPSAPASA